MGEKRSTWASIDADMHRDEKIAQIADQHGARAIAYWTVLICESKLVHKTNDGWAGPFTLDQFAALCYDEKTTRKKVRELLEAFIAMGLLEVRNDLVRRWHARPTRFLQRQQRAVASARKGKSRSLLQGKSPDSHVSVTPMSQKTGPYNNNDNNNDNDNNNSGVRGRPPDRTTTLAAQVVDGVVDPEERFDFYRAATSGGFGGVVPSVEPRQSGERAEFTAELRSILEPLVPVESERVMLAAQIWDRSQRPYQSGEGALPAAAWLRAARVMVREFQNGKRITDDPMKLLYRMVPSYLVEGSDKPVTLAAAKSDAAGLSLEERKRREMLEIAEQTRRLRAEAEKAEQTEGELV